MNYGKDLFGAEKKYSEELQDIQLESKIKTIEPNLVSSLKANDFYDLNLKRLAQPYNNKFNSLEKVETPLTPSSPVQQQSPKNSTSKFEYFMKSNSLLSHRNTLNNTANLYSSHKNINLNLNMNERLVSSNKESVNENDEKVSKLDVKVSFHK